jgi:soluble lytic murein transglycosylase-like protein
VINFILAFLITISTGFGVWQVAELNIMIIPIPKIEVNTSNPIKELIKRLGCPKDRINEITEAVELASEQTKIDSCLLSVLMFTESNFNYKAESNKGYKGLMQTPTATKQWADVDILHGARILQEKLKISKGDIFKALSLYKGGENPMARKQARQVLTMYKRIIG